jgi:hypothetical protein
MNQMKKYKLLFIFIIFIISGCTSLSQKLQSILEKKETVNTVEPKKVTNYCEDDENTQALLEDPQFISGPIFKTTSFTFIEKAVLISLIEMERRPDITSPYSRLQVMAQINGQYQYYDFHPKDLNDDTKISYLYGLDFLLKKNHSKYSLSSLVKFIDRSWTPHYLVSSEFAGFLAQNKIDIQKNNILSKHYLKGDEILTKFETFDRPNLQKSLAIFEKQKLFDDSFYEHSKNDLFSSNTKDNSVRCNFDINKDFFTSDDLFFDKEYSSNSFAFSENNNYFIAVASSQIKKPIELKDEFYFSAKPASTPLPTCLLYNPVLKSELSIISTTGRNPSQHIKHLIDYDLNNAPSKEPLTHTLNFARHLFLSNPDRILYESNRGRREQLNFFLQMNFPIYHVDQLGDILALVHNQNDKTNSIIKDDRSNKKLLCIP